MPEGAGRGRRRHDGQNTYLTDIRHRADFGPIREEFFGKKMPAHTLVAVAALAAPEFLIEIEAVAVL
jgi:enamine deaminase RidA (YjgF/YER057c/UK114 family)